MRNSPAGMRIISSWAGNLIRSAASFFPSGVHSLVTSATSNAYRAPLTLKTVVTMVHPAIHTFRTMTILLVSAQTLHRLLTRFRRSRWLIKLFQRFEVEGQLKQDR